MRRKNLILAIRVVRLLSGSVFFKSSAFPTTDQLVKWDGTKSGQGFTIDICKISPTQLIYVSVIKSEEATIYRARCEGAMK